MVSVVAPTVADEVVWSKRLADGRGVGQRHVLHLERRGRLGSVGPDRSRQAARRNGVVVKAATVADTCTLNEQLPPLVVPPESVTLKRRLVLVAPATPVIVALAGAWHWRRPKSGDADSAGVGGDAMPEGKVSVSACVRNIGVLLGC